MTGAEPAGNSRPGMAPGRAGVALLATWSGMWNGAVAWYEARAATEIEETARGLADLALDGLRVHDTT